MREGWPAARAAGWAAGLAWAAAQGGCGDGRWPADGGLAPPPPPAAIVHGGGRAAGPPPRAGLAVGALMDRGCGHADRLADRLCSATLIAPNVVLTAAHCLLSHGIPRRDLYFSLAAQLWTGPDRRPAFAACRRIVRVARAPPPSAAADGAAPAPTPAPDVGLGFLDAAITDVQPARVAGLNAVLAGEPSAGQLLWLVGYGVRTSPAISAWADDDGVRSWAASPLVAGDAHELRVGGPGLPQRCRGDSGGATLAPDDDGDWLVLAVGSRPAGARACIDGGIEVRVDALSGWLRRELARRPDLAAPGAPRPAGGTAGGRPDG